MSGTRLFGQAAAETGYRTYEFNDDAALIDALMKLRSSTDGTTTFGWLKADRSAYIYGQVVPLMGLLAGILHKARKVKDGVYALTTLEVTYYLDPETDKLLTQLKMPGSGQVVDVPLYRSGPKEIEVSALSRIVEESTGAAGETSDADEAPASPSGTFAPAGQVKLDRSVGPAFEVDDMVWIKTSEYGRVTPASADDRPVFYNESTTYQGKKIEIEDDSVVSASAQFAYSASTSWRPWMKMGDIDGHTMSNGIGAKVTSIDNLPAQFLELTEQYHPDVLRDPDAILSAAQ